MLFFINQPSQPTTIGYNKKRRLDKLRSSLLPSDNLSEVKENWVNLSLQALNQAYGEDEPEYALELVKEFNPEYERK